MIMTICIVGIVLLTMTNKMSHRLMIGSILTVIVISSQILLLADTHYHWGAELNTESTEKIIYPLISFPGSNNVLAYRNIGNGKEQKQIYVYTDHPQSKKKEMTYSDGVTIKLRHQRQTDALRVKSVIKYHYTNRLDQVLFAGITNNNQIKKTTISFMLPKNWFVLSDSDLIKTSQSLKKNKASMQKTISEQLKSYLRKHPKETTRALTIKKIENGLIRNETQRILAKYATY